MPSRRRRGGGGRLSWLLLTGLGCAVICATLAGNPFGRVAAAGSGGRTLTLAYCSPGGVPLDLDLSYPGPASRRPVPVAVFVHGGSWTFGTRRAGDLVEVLRPAVLARGMAFAAVDYRLAGTAPWPAQLQDVACAVRSLRSRSALLGLDPHRVTLVGASSGGHLAALLAMGGGSVPVDVGQYPNESSRPDAVVDLYGPADLYALRGWGAVRRVFGSGARRLRDASPVRWVAPGAPPFLLVHGDADQLVPLAQSRQLQRRLLAASDAVSLLVVHGGPHGLGSPAEQPPRRGSRRGWPSFWQARRDDRGATGRACGGRDLRSRWCPLQDSNL